MIFMSNEKIMSFKEALVGIEATPATFWVYLPADQNWNLDSECAILESDEVPPELEDDPDAGVPEFAKQNNLVQALSVAVLQDIVINARTQKPNATLDDLLRAFAYYFEHDAFIDLKG